MGKKKKSSHPELKFFNSLSARLYIDLSEPPEQIANLLNVRATPDAEILRLELRAEVFIEEESKFRPLTDEEYHSVAFQGSSITLQSEDGDPITHNAPNGSHFTVRELLQAVEETERRTRGQTEWLGGIDVHHVYFEGIHKSGDVWEIYWGS